MKDIYCLWQKRIKGVPVAMNAVLAENFNINDPMPPMDYEWMRSRIDKKVKFPKKLWLIVKEKLLLFDYYPAFNGFIVSKKFLEILRKFKKDESFQFVPLETISHNKIEITPKTYFYLVFHQRESLINYEDSKYILKKDAKIDFVKKMGFGIDIFNEIVLNETKISNHYFILNDTTFSRFLFCSKNFKDELEKSKLYGFDMVHYKAMPYIYNQRFNPS